MDRDRAVKHDTLGAQRTKTSVIAVGLAATAMLAGASATGCSGDSSTSMASSGSTSSARTSSSTSGSKMAEPSDYTGLLIGAGDIATPNHSYTTRSYLEMWAKCGHGTASRPTEGLLARQIESDK